MKPAEAKKDCRQCNGTGFEPVVGRGVRPCACLEESRLRNRMEQARIPARFSNAAFSTFQASNPSLQRALFNSKQFVEEYPAVDCGLLYLGRPGVGKSHLACSVLRGLIEKDVSGLFYDFRDLLKEIQDSYNPNTNA